MRSARALKIFGVAAAASIGMIIGEVGQPSAAFPGENGRILAAGNSDVFSFKSSGGRRKNLTADYDSYASSPAASPNGKLIVFEGGSGGIWRMRKDGSNKQLVTDTSYVHDPVWSGNGKRIALSDDGDIITIRKDGTGFKNLTDANPDNDDDPAWSPDNKWIAFERNEGGEDDIWIMRKDGSGVKQLTETGADEDDPKFSPDGKWIVFEHDFGSNGNTSVKIMRADGKRVGRLTTRVADNDDPQFSPNGKRIIWSKGSPENLWTMKIDGSKKRLLRDGGFVPSLRGPDWLPR